MKAEYKIKYDKIKRIKQETNNYRLRRAQVSTGKHR